MPPRHKKKRKNRAAAAEAAAAKRRDWRVGDLVVAKLRGYRPWPAQIQRPEDYGQQARAHKIFVTFFGTEDTCFCSQNNITPFTSAMRKELAEQLQKINTSPDLEKAIKEIFAADDELKVSMRSESNFDAADDELKVSMRSESNFEDEKSEEEEDEQPPEPSSKPPPLKKAKIASQEHAVVLQETQVHSAGKESSRHTRLGAAAAAAAAATSANQSKQEETPAGSSVEDLAAHQVHKLPRKLRIKVSTQSPDIHPNPEGNTAVATDKETPSPPQYWGSPKTAAAEAEGFSNGDVEMEDAAAHTSGAEVSTVGTEFAKEIGEHSSANTPAEDSDSFKADEGNSAEFQGVKDLEVTGEKAVQEVEKESERETHASSKIEEESDAKAEVAASPVDEGHAVMLSNVIEGGKETVSVAGEAADVAGEHAVQGAGKDTESTAVQMEIYAPFKIDTTEEVVAGKEPDADVKVDLDLEVTVEEPEQEVEDSESAAVKREAHSPSKIDTATVVVAASEGDAEAKGEAAGSPAGEGHAEKLSNAVGDAKEEGRVAGEAVDVAVQGAGKDTESTAIIMETDAPFKVDTEVLVAGKEADAETKVELTASSVDEDHLQEQGNIVDGTGRVAHAGSEGTETATPLLSVEENSKFTGAPDPDGSIMEVEKEPGHDAGRGADTKDDDSKIAAPLESVKASSESTGIEPGDKDHGDTAQADEKASHSNSTAYEIKEEKINDNVASQTEVKDSTRTVEERTASEDCLPAQDKIELEASGGCPIDVNVQKRCENEGSVEDEQPANIEEDMGVGAEISQAKVRDIEAPAVAEGAINGSLPPTTVLDKVNGVEKDEECDAPTTVEQKLEETSADINQGKKNNESAALIGGAVEDVKENETTVRPPQEEKVSHLEDNVGTVEKVSRMQSALQIEDETDNPESTQSEKSVEEKTEATITQTSIEEVVEKDQEMEMEKDRVIPGMITFRKTNLRQRPTSCCIISKISKEMTRCILVQLARFRILLLRQMYSNLGAN
ncbi:hypothetical protein R1flu_015062 [Riccia fluitans]|uniref:PWWP domain-containing protein n=1 Tax=Riccia fluitans TaxID=41844 RepID=A0ABD1YHV1_9MARC